MARKTKKRVVDSALPVYQLKITLTRIQPPIWRRIQIKDCTLDKLHQHIQTAMGWYNCHLYQFTINGICYCNPQFYEAELDIEVSDSRRVRLSAFVPGNGEQSHFLYEYDFGDSWHHGILFEGCLFSQERGCYPLCLEGARACPPEDVGGCRGYQEFVRAITDPGHQRHKEFMEWHGPYDAEAFDVEAVTKRMRRGLPKLRDDEDWL